MSGVKGKSGRRPYKTTDIRNELQGKPERVRDLLLKLYDAGMQGSIDAAKFYVTMVLGQPKQQIDQNVKSMVLNMSANDYDSMARQLITHQNKLLSIEHPGEVDTVVSGEVQLIESKDKASIT